MSNPFLSDHPHLQGYHAPLATESDAPHLPIRGKVPQGLSGTLYRNGPNPQFAPRGFYHWFYGDGMLHAFHIGGDRVSYRNRWIRTPRWELENELGAALALDDRRRGELDSTNANTNVVKFAGRLLALEEAHAPFEVDPATLAPRGYHDFGGELRSPMTAHPKVDPKTGEMVFFGYDAAGLFTPEIALGVVAPDGRLTRRESLVAPYPAMVHDFVVTDRWIIVPIFPIAGSAERARNGRHAYAWEPHLGAHVAFVPRRGGDTRARWIAIDPCYVFHFMNAFDAADGRVVVDGFRYPTPPFFPPPEGAPPVPRAEPAQLFRWTFDPEGGRVGAQVLADPTGEFPRIDERFAGRPYRHGYYCAAKGDGEGGGIAHVDHATGRCARYRVPAGDHASEPVFVPRCKDAPEGDGWLLTVVYRGAEDRSDLVVLDAGDVAAGPVAVAHLSHRVPAGFHGAFVGGPR
jgi:carotenoid cleavage dioxygenase